MVRSDSRANYRQHEAGVLGLCSRRGSIYSVGHRYGFVSTGLSLVRSRRRDTAAGAPAGADPSRHADFRTWRRDENICYFLFLRLADPAQHDRWSAQSRLGAVEYRKDVRFISRKNLWAGDPPRLLAADYHRAARQFADHAHPGGDLRNDRQHRWDWLF